jgi:hypothetical protein
MVDKSVSLPRSCEASVKPALGAYGGDTGGVSIVGSQSQVLLFDQELYVLCMSDRVVVQYQGSLCFSCGGECSSWFIISL